MDENKMNTSGLAHLILNNQPQETKELLKGLDEDRIQRINASLLIQATKEQAVEEVNHYRRSIWWSAVWLFVFGTIGAVLGAFFGQKALALVSTNLWASMIIFAFLGFSLVNVWDGAIAERLFVEIGGTDEEKEERAQEIVETFIKNEADQQKKKEEQAQEEESENEENNEENDVQENTNVSQLGEEEV